jgi:hypothetical protein
VIGDEVGFVVGGQQFGALLKIGSDDDRRV